MPLATTRTITSSGRGSHSSTVSMAKGPDLSRDDGGLDLHVSFSARIVETAHGRRQFLPASICASTAAVGQQSTFSPLRF